MLQSLFTALALLFFCNSPLVESFVYAPKVQHYVESKYRYRADGKPGRVVSFWISGIGAGAKVTAQVIHGLSIQPGECSVKEPNSISLLLPEGIGVTRDDSVTVNLQTPIGNYSKSFRVPRYRHWTVYIYPHSHVDIGYTADQETVKQLHIRNIDVAIDLARKTANYPEGARFVWNPEATWVVTSYLQRATKAQRDTLISAIRKGWIRIDAAHSNLNTSLCSDEELVRSFQNSQQISRLSGKPITTMVQMDVPGAAWGLAGIAAENGIKGILSFPNYYDLRNVHENKPFYWLAPNRKERVLFLQATSYGWGYRLKGRHYGLARSQSYANGEDRLTTDNPLKNFLDPFIFQQTRNLEDEKSPYDIFAMTWSMADNCLIDADLPEAVKQWNALYAWPKLKIAGAEEIVKAYEAKYSKDIPQLSGDFTEFWTQGPASDAHSLAAARLAKEELIQAETAGILLNSPNTQQTEADAAWEDLFLALEHTWGVQDPTSAGAKKVEEAKAAYFSDAKQLSSKLTGNVFGSLNSAPGSGITVLNTLGWPRTGLITVPANKVMPECRVLDQNGKELVSQKLSTGELVFLPEAIPAHGSAFFKLLPGKAQVGEPMQVSGNSLDNGLINIQIDNSTGAINSIISNAGNYNYADKKRNGINSYYYMKGVFDSRIVADAPTGPSKTSLTVKERGPLVISLLVTSSAPGCTALTREVRLIKGQKYVELINTIQKEPTLAKEGMHYGFAFNLPGAMTRIDVPWGVMRPEDDQLPAANRNWMTFQRWVSVANQDHGVTWSCLESPLIEYGSMSGNVLDGGRQNDLWIKKLESSQTFYSWVMNNHWATNFPLQQSGTFTSTYRILLHDAYSAVTSGRFGYEHHRPLLAAWSTRKIVVKQSLSIGNPQVMISALKKSADKKAVILRLRSLSDKQEDVEINWPIMAPTRMYVCSVGEEKVRETKGVVSISPYGLATIRAEFNTSDK